LTPDNHGRRRFALLAPPHAHTHSFADIAVSPQRHYHLLAQAQRLRGRIYLQDGAIETSQLTPDGRHVQKVDEMSWHLLTVDKDDRVLACTRYMSHRDGVSFPELMVSHSALAKCDVWGRPLRTAIAAELMLARQRRCSYVEMGGWAISETLRCTTEAVRMVLTVYALAQMFGGALGISTVTTRHCSASILRRIGGGPLSYGGTGLPSYYDPQYKCDMEILRFDSSRPNSRYRAWIDECRNFLMTVPVIAADFELEKTA
jgi:hypothetical protein